MSLEADVRVRLADFRLSASVHLKDGASLAVLGPNGSGKTTLLRTIAGLQTMESGKVVLDGVVYADSANGVSVPPEKRELSMVFQDLRLFPHMNSLQNVAFGLRSRRVPKKEAMNRAREELIKLGAGELLRSKPGQLSAGQAQRVALARVLAIRPRLLMLDEPLAALDASYRPAARAILRNSLDQFGGLSIVVAHDPIDAMSLADRVAILESGTIVQEGTPDEIIRGPRSRFVADLIGVNLLRGQASGTNIKVGEIVLEVPEEHSGEVFVHFPPEVVSLFVDRPTGSPRNIWESTVSAVELVGPRVLVRFDHPVAIRAEVSRASFHELGIQPGSRFWLALKAVEIQVSGEGSHREEEDS